MSRVIKFRIWEEAARSYLTATYDPSPNSGHATMNHYWSFWQSPESGDMIGFTSPCLEVVRGNVVETGGCAFVLEQFTGLFDKNGKEIYEGDIVSGMVNERDHTFRSNLEVWWQGTSWVFGRYKSDYGGGEWGHQWISMWHVMRKEETEVIGNIHENPELLKS